ncbi:hypothetical protein SUNI508_04605 [Seiridium unicorne]|uniref:FAD/NAD(P)-binding domain-containing protein n=1 Tax=Seiridium unicorne TaxID=138068 RepID=A0ABR2V8K0_9PEZI
MTSNTATYNATKPVRVFVAGGCYAGLAAAIEILERCDIASPPIPVLITIVDERDGFYHVISTPLALADKTYAEKAWVKFRDIKILQRPDVRFIHGSVKAVNCDAKSARIAVGEKEVVEGYDYFIGAAGLRRVWPVVPQALTRDAYLEEACKHIDSIAGSKHPILVIGGGAVGIEMAAELKLWHPNTRVILAHSRDKLLSAEPLSDTFKERSLRILRESGVEVILNHRLSESKSIEEGNEVYFTNGERLTAGVIVMAISRSVPSTDFLPKEALDQDAYVNVLPSQQFCGNVPNSAVHFAAGDMINWSGIKRCGSSMHMGKLVGWNVYQSIMRDLSRSIEKPKFKELGPVPPMITIAVGKKAVSCGPRGTTSGKRTMRLFFEDDLGFRIVWDYLRLGCEPGSVLTWKQSAVNILVYMFPEVRSIWTKLIRTENKKA